MRDEETGSWWQQVTGEAFLGPLEGRHLTPVSQDEISFALWKGKHPLGRVLRPDPKVQAAGRYAKADWESRMAKLPVATRVQDRRLDPRELVVGFTVNGRAKAYRMTDIQRQNPIVDTIGGAPVAIIVPEDGKSVHAFTRVVEGKTLELFAKPAGTSIELVDSTTGSEWDFDGRAIRGPFAGRQLPRIEVLRDYWFDWRTYHPDTLIYRVGL